MKGATLLEVLVAMTIVAILLAIAIPAARNGLDRTVVRTAAADVRATLSLGRSLALAGRSVVVVDVDTGRGTLRVRRAGDTLVRRDLAFAHGVRVTATRDSLTYDPYGLGRGAANMSVLIRKGAAVETVFVSRMGRIR